MNVRKFRKEDAINASGIISKCCQTVLSSDYSEHDIKDLVIENSPEELIEKSKRINYFVAVENNKILGIGGYDKTNVCTLFVKPKLHGRGIGKTIIEKILSEARKGGIKTLDTWSTFHAENFILQLVSRRLRHSFLKDSAEQTLLLS